MLYGHTPRHFGIGNLTACTIPDLEKWLIERELLSKLIQQHLLRAQQRMKSHGDKKRSERIFHVGDLVYLKVQPYIQTKVATRLNQKLSFNFFGPFKIMQKVGRAAYKLELPPSCKIHSIVHVSLLKQHVSPHTESILIYLQFQLIQRSSYHLWRFWTNTWFKLGRRPPINCWSSGLSCLQS